MNPSIIFGDFGQLPPVGDSALYSTTHLQPRPHSPPLLRSEGYQAYKTFNKSLTLTHISQQGGSHPEQELFQDMLLRLRSCETTPQDYQKLRTRFWS